MTEMRTCPKCKTTLPKDTKHFMYSEKRDQYGYCKPCMKAYEKARYKMKISGMEEDDESENFNGVSRSVTDKGTVLVRFGRNYNKGINRPKRIDPWHGFVCSTMI